MYNCKLPSGISVSVNPPSFHDRMEAVKEYRSVKDEVGYSVEELLQIGLMPMFNITLNGS